MFITTLHAVVYFTDPWN